MLTEIQVNVTRIDVSITIINDTMLTNLCLEPLILTCVGGIRRCRGLQLLSISPPGSYQPVCYYS
jgi:hypothetical protein